MSQFPRISIALLPGVLAAATGLLAQEAHLPQAVHAPALERIAIIGASVTDGFLLPNEVHAMVTIADVVQGICAEPIDLPFRRSSMLFFRSPVDYGTRFARDALAEQPTLLVAIDFLFWFGYGFSLDQDSRLKRLETGLALLEPFHCPVLVGDFPDMHSAATAGVGIHGAPMISPWQVPAKETLIKLNGRLREWAAHRNNVHIVEMNRFLEHIRAGDAIGIRGYRWPPHSQQLLVDKDLLHTTFEGTIALCLLALDTLVRAEKSVPAEALIWDPRIIRARVFAHRAQERRQRMERTDPKDPEHKSPASKNDHR